MQTNSQEFETKPSSNKDLWLFLIVLDVIFLCVFGFFLYKHFSVQLFNPAPAPVAAPAQQAQEELPVIETEEVVTVEETPASVTATEEVVVAEPVKETPKAPAKEPAKEPVQEVAAAPEAPAAQPAAKEAKPSIVVTPTSGKYRRVTFRWFDPAETVSIVSGFTNRKPQSLKKTGDHWETTLSIAPGTYKFLYVVDGKNTLDPYAEQKDGRSVLVVE